MTEEKYYQARYYAAGLSILNVTSLVQNPRQLLHFTSKGGGGGGGGGGRVGFRLL